MGMHLRQNKVFSQKIYWINKLSGELPETNLILDYIRPSLSSTKNKSISFDLSHDLSQAIIKLAKGSYFSMYLILVSALKILLQKYTQNNDVIVGIPIYDKIGTNDLNSKVIPLRIQVIPQLSFKDFLLQIKDSVIGAYSHQNYHFDELIQLLEIPTSPNRCPFFDIVVLLENIHNKNNLNHFNNDITFYFLINDENISANIEYSEHLFQDETIQLISIYYTNIIESIINNVDTKISEILLLKDSEQYHLLKQFNDNTKEYPIEQTINKLFEQQVYQTPNNIAVVDGHTKLTYQELNEKANQLALKLRQLGLGKGEFVGIFKDRDINFLIAILAIYKAGGAYVPIDSTYPSNRIEYMLSNSEVKFLLTDTPLLTVLTDLIYNCPQLKSIICLDGFIPESIQLTHHQKLTIYDQLGFINLTKDNLEQINDASDPAYMLYTSGSTGLPKGAIVRHDGAINHIYAQFDELELTEEFCFLQSAPSSTDISVWQFLAPLLIGGRTVIVDIETVTIPEKLFKVLKSEEITVVELVPALFGGLLEHTSGLANNERELPSLKWMMVVGEPVSVNWVNKWLQIYPEIKIVNAYGPTEAADDITQFIVDKPLPENQRTIPIGKPLANLNLYILDKEMKLLPIGAPGEICVSGIGVGAGYWKNEEKTKLSFVPNPFTDASKKLPANRADLIYKTGDLGRWLSNGNIEFLGRIDHQVKIRGFRVELGEIETFLLQHEAVREVVVVVREENPGDKRLVAYVVPKSEFCHDDSTSSELVQQLRDFLQQKLPGHMVPSAIVQLEALPLAPSGKVDRGALPVPSFNQESELGFVAPRTPTEQIVADIWGQVLKQEHVGIHDNFFDLGGHSLLATQVISRLREAFKIELPLRSLFEAPTVAQLVEGFINKNNIPLAADKQPISPVTRQENLPLSFAQQRLWFLAQLEPDSPLYNIPAAVRLQGQLNVEALQQSFNEIISRHEALRTNFQTREGQAVAVISEEKPITLSIFDISDLPANQQEAEIKQQAAQAAQQPFDISSDHLLRGKLLLLGEQEHILLMTIHHIVSDGWSIGVLVEELATLYHAFCNGQPSPLPTLPIQYVDFAAWQRQWLQGQALETQLSYWLKQLENAPKVLELPTDYPRPAIQTYRGATYSFELSKELSTSLNKLSQQQGSTLFMTLLAGFQILIWRYTGQQDIVVGSPIANRNRAEIEGLIGFFVNTLVLRTNLAGNPSFEELLKRVREVALGAYAHQDLPFELLVEQLQPQRDLSHTPLFQVMFVLQNAPMSALELPGLTLTQLESVSSTAHFDLTLLMTETESGLVGSFEYSTDLFAESSIQRMVGHLQTLFEAIVANPQQRLSDLPLLTEFEQHQLLREWNNTATNYPQDKCIHELFEAQVEKTPDAIAVVFENQQLTYCELNNRANQLAHYLQQLGVKPEVLVGICVERSLLMVIGLLAILKAGGAYVPLDPNYPQERIAFILEDTQAPVLLTQSSLMEDKPKHQAAVVCLDTDWYSIAQQSQENLFSELTTENLAYTIYTSGSTGKPKGVMIKHGSTVAMLDWANQTFSPQARSGVLASTSICFDLSVFEVFVPLCCGGKVILIENALHLPTLPALERVTLINTVPSVITQLIRNNSIPATVQVVNIAGEPLSNQLVQQLYRQNNIEQVLNLYGPSEDTTYSTFSCIRKDATITPPIGRPIHNTQVYLLDDNLQPVPVSVAGMLYLGGVGLARGYFDQPELTADRFIPNPYATLPGERLYKTGDLARYRANGEIEYIGRVDNQVKMRGFRIELGEIEAQLSQYPGVETAVVTVDALVGESQRIVAYIVSKTEQRLTISELRGFLEAKLPSYMIPAAFVILETLPLTPNGKVDRKALPIPDSIRPHLEVVYQPPQTEIEQTIADIWQNLLNLEDVGIHDNFFELGGHSLLLVQAHSQFRQVFKRDLSVLDLFRYPTINSLSNYFNQTENQQVSDDIMLDSQERIADGKAQQRKRLQKMKSGEKFNICLILAVVSVSGTYLNL